MSLESLLLKEQKVLIDSGIPHKDIKLRGICPVVRNRIHARVVNGAVTFIPTLAEVAPNPHQL